MSLTEAISQNKRRGVKVKKSGLEHVCVKVGGPSTSIRHAAALIELLCRPDEHALLSKLHPIITSRLSQ